MWKWLAVAVLIYGLIAAGTIVAPRSMLLVSGMDLAALGQAWRDGNPPQFYDFEAPAPPPLTRPPASAQVVAAGEGNRIMRWEPPPDAPFALLGLPLAAPASPPAALAIRLRAEGLPRLAVGLREEDGSVYSIELPAGPDWQAHVIPLDRLRPGPRTVDENAQLDPEQVTAVFLAAVEPPRRQQRQRGREEGGRRGPPPPVVELDDFGFAPLARAD